jgi:REP element-mobilizing transposase RayT
MRRIKVGEDRSAVYHVITRTVNGDLMFGDTDKEMLRRMMWQAARFSGVEILTYCLLSNHFHILLRVPEKKNLEDSEILRRYRLLYPKDTAYTKLHGDKVMANDPTATVETTLAQGGPEAEKLRASLLRRMGDVSEFMKTLKQRFSVWFNRTHKRYGTLWAERFKSVLVEDDDYPLATVAAYIDLNPVRAGLVEDAKDYRFCGYAEAVGEGNAQIRQGLQSVIHAKDWRTVLREYRLILFGKGTMEKADGSKAGTISWEKTREVLNEGGRLPASTALRCKVRYFTDGAVLGSKGFVSDVLRDYQEATGRRLDQKEPRPVGGSEAWQKLTTMRGLRRAVFG